jgi:cysteine-S-conjugate beta-lyase
LYAHLHMPIDFDARIDRTATASVKWDGRKDTFGRDDVIPLWVADMDFAVPPPVRAALARRLAHGVFGYTRMPTSFAAAVASWLALRHAWPVRQEWVGSCPSVVFGLHAAVRAFSKPGDAVVTQPPVYYPFYRAIEAAGRTVVRNRLVLESGRYRMDLADLQQHLAAGARLLLLCSPHNPGGRVWERGELEAVLAVAARNDAIVVCDEIHADLAFFPARHTPIGSLPGAEQRVVTLSGPTKAFNFPGIPVGFSVIPDTALRDRFAAEVRRVASPGPSIFAVDALQAAYTEGDGWLSEVLAYLADNRAAVELFVRASLPAAAPMVPEGGYLFWVDFRGTGADEARVHEALVAAGVGLSRGSTFGPEGSGFMRLNFGCPRSLLDEALDRAAAVVQGLAGAKGATARP